MSWRVAIVEDEPASREWLANLVRQDRDWNCVGTFESAEQVIPACEEYDPHLLLLDISLYGRDVFEVLTQWPLAHRPKLIFITASENHAVRAFEEEAVDYVLKPYGAERLQKALERAKGLLAQPEGSRHPSIVNAPALAYLRHVKIQEGGQGFWIPVEQIDWIEGADYYVRIHVGPKAYWSRHSLKSLEQNLDPDRFHRIHKSTLIQLARADVYLEGTLAGMEVIMKSGARLKVSRRKKKELLQKLKPGPI